MPVSKPRPERDRAVDVARLAALGTWLFTRAQRLCRPVFWYLATWAVALLVVRVTLVADSATALGRECVALLWFLGVYLVVLAFVPVLTRLRSGRAVALVVAVGNGGAMTLYLWHIPAIAVAAFVLHAIGLDSYDVSAVGFWGLLALRAVVFSIVMAVAFRLLAPLEHRRLPWWDAPVRASGARSIVAGALMCVAGVALVLLAKNGLNGFAGWAALGCFLAAALIARMSACGDVREDREDREDMDVPELGPRMADRR